MHFLRRGAHPTRTTLAVAALLWGFAVTVARAIRLPNDWAEAHWLTSYELGFLKRALPGTLILPILHAAGPGHAETTIAVVSCLIFAASCAVLGMVLLRILSRNAFSTDAVLLVLVFATSSYIVMAGHLVGYYDHILVLLTVAACICALHHRVWSATLIVSAGLFVHETIFIVGYPSVVFVALLENHGRNDSATRTASLVQTARRWLPLLVIPPLVLVGLVLYQSMMLDAGDVRASLTSHLQHFPFVQRKRQQLVPQALTTSFLRYLEIESPRFLRRLTSLRHMRSKLGTVGVLFLAGWSALRTGPHRHRLFATFAAVSLAPLLLLLIARDTSRIAAYPIFVSLIGVWTITETSLHPADRPACGRGLPALLAIVVAANVLLTTRLMDKTADRFTLTTRLFLYAPVLCSAAWMAATRRTARGA